MPPPVQGGGGTTVPTALVALSPTNAQDAAAGATLTGLETSNNLSTQVDGASALSTTIPQRLPQTHVLGRIIRQQIDQLTQHLQTSPAVPVAAALTPHNCDKGGKVDVASNGPNSVTETFAACSPAADVTIDGTITIDNVSVDPGVSFNGSAALDLVIKQTGFPDVSVTGSNVSLLETINVNVVAFTLSGPELLIATTGNTERLGNFNLTSSFDTNAGTETDDISFGYASTKLGGAVNVSTDTPFVTDLSMNRQFPHTGVLSLSGTGGSKIRVTINGDETLATPQLKIEVDADGNGTFETSVDKNWADLVV